MNSCCGYKRGSDDLVGAIDVCGSSIVLVSTGPVALLWCRDDGRATIKLCTKEAFVNIGYYAQCGRHCIKGKDLTIPKDQLKQIQH